MTKKITHHALLLTVFLLSSCIKLFPEASTNEKTILLELTDLKVDKAKKVDWQLLIEKPTAPSHLNTSLIAVSNQDGTANYIENAQWADDLPDILHTNLIDAFIISNKIMGVGRSAIGLDVKYTLHVDINDFELDTSKEKEPHIKISLTAQLMEMLTRKVTMIKTFTTTLPVSYNNIKSTSQSFNQALETVLSKIVVWTLSAP